MQCLRLYQGSIQPALGEQLRVIPVLDDLALIQHKDTICFLDGGQTVGYDEGGSARMSFTK